MEILIDGQPLPDGTAKAGSSLKDAMDQVVRVLNQREMLAAAVRVNGREVERWDESTVALAEGDRIDVSTMSMRDYAVASLGDVGEYTGNVLAVLRNVDAIVSRDGFDALRSKLGEGLDYILHVIETAGHILPLNMKEARYDMRSGEQMLKELQAIHARIRNAKKFDDMKSDLATLEFTLTDWLKFLETLLRRYADQQAEMGTAEEVAGDARGHAEALERLGADLKALVDDLYAGKVAKSMDALPSRITILQESLIYIQKLRKFGVVHYDSLRVKDDRMSDKIPHLSQTLKELSEAIQVGDTVLMRDLIEYEILPFISYLRDVFKQISSSPS